jgi:hypothetical protein
VQTEDGKRGETMNPELSYQQLPQELIDIMNRVRRLLSENGYAYGALYIVEAETKQAMFLMPEKMPLTYRVALLDEISQDAATVAHEFRKII